MNNKALMAILAGTALLAGCAGKQAEVSYAKDIKPILDKSCLDCHVAGGAGEQKSGLNMSSYESFMKGTKFGPVIDAGNSANSTLVRLVSGHADPSLKMPHGGRAPLSAEEIDKLKRWIDQGAKNN